jgi:AAA family ATP:ADP antiporter
VQGSNERRVRTEAGARVGHSSTAVATDRVARGNPDTPDAQGGAVHRAAMLECRGHSPPRPLNMSTTPDEAPSRTLGWLGLRAGDERPTLALGLVHLLLFTGYYVARPLRDEIAAHVRDEIDDLWTAVFFVMLAIAPLFAWFARRRTRSQVLSQTIGVFALCALAFAVLLGAVPLPGTGFTGLEGEARLWLERVFYVWSSVLALLPVSAFWSYASDVCSLERAKRVFGVVAAAATLGQLLGANLVAALSSRGVEVGALLLLVASVLAATAGAAVLVDRSLRRAARLAHALHGGPAPAADERIGGTLLSGLTAVVRSPALRGVCIYFLLYTAFSTVYYFVQSDIVGELIAERTERRAYLARLEIAVALVTLALQAGLSGPMMRRLGLGATLLGLPVVCIAGVLVVYAVTSGGLPTDDAEARAGVLASVGAVLVAQRIARYVFAKPAREALFTRVGREERFVSKNFIDTAVYRGGDVLAAQVWAALAAAGFATPTLAVAAVPLMLLWGWHCLRLPRAQ